MKSIIAFGLLLVSSTLGHVLPPRSVAYNELLPSERALVDATNLVVRKP